MRIVLGDEQSLFRQAMRAVMTNESDMEIVAEAGDGVQAVAAAEQLRPDVVVLNASLPNCDGIRATAMIRERLPTCRILVLSEQDDEAELLCALEAGANAYLTKASALTDLIAATRSIHEGGTVVPPLMLGGLLSRLIRRREEQDDAIRRLARLTRREREVVALLAEGADNDAIAQSLVISPQTARTHLQNAIDKLGLHSRLEAAMFANQNSALLDLVSID
ncbi:MAG: response regulator transcription factor [Actinobacteria bacterium]|nr:MAG: response regulator transcription factor [Actinomycetota bacterium]